MGDSVQHFNEIMVELSEKEDEQNRNSKDVEVIEKNIEDNTFISQSRVDNDNLMGMVVNNGDEAYNLYNEYAVRKGFSVRRSKTRYICGKSNTRELRHKEFRCSKAGLKAESSSPPKSFRNKYLTKSDCKAMIRFKIEDGLWTVSHFVAEHNHELAPPSKAYLLRSAPKASVVSSLVNAGIHTKDIFAYIAGEEAGEENTEFVRRDCYSEKMLMIEARDAQSLINCFKKQEAMDAMFSFDIQVDQENRLTNFFWRDGKSFVDYDLFGDVVIFDTTYRENRYNLVCAPFIGLNHHRQKTMFGCALLLDETTESFVWLFKSFLSSMGGRAPKTIITDQDEAISNAIEVVFPHTCHRLCLWHMEKHFPSHLGDLNSNPEFRKSFFNCLYGCESEDKFQETWEKMLNTFDLKEHSWLQNLYTLRNKWSVTVPSDTFSAGLLSTQRSESIDSVLKGLGSDTASLTQFFIAFERMVAGWRTSEVEEDFQCSNGKPQLFIKNSGILNHAANVYTHKNFQLFEDEFKDAIGLMWSQVSCVDDVSMFQVNGGEDSQVCHVRLNTSTSEISCSCKKFESSGILCCHVLKIMIVKNYDSIPEKYILNRWSKDAIKRWLSGEATEVCGDDTKMVYRHRMVHLAYDTILKSQVNEASRKFVEDGLLQICRDVHAALNELNLSVYRRGDSELVDGQNELQDTNGDGPFLNPAPVKSKGASKAKLGVKTKAIGKKGASTSKSSKNSNVNERQKVLLPKTLAMCPPYPPQYQVASSTHPYHGYQFGVASSNMNFGGANVPYGFNIMPQNTNQREYLRSLPLSQQQIQPSTNVNKNLPGVDASASKEGGK